MANGIQTLLDQWRRIGETLTQMGDNLINFAEGIKTGHLQQLHTQEQTQTQTYQPGVQAQQQTYTQAQVQAQAQAQAQLQPQAQAQQAQGAQKTAQSISTRQIEAGVMHTSKKMLGLAAGIAIGLLLTSHKERE